MTFDFKKKRRNEGVLRRQDAKFNQEIKDIINQRIKLGRDTIQTKKSETRITKAIRRHPQFKFIKSDIIRNRLEDDLDDK